jgi:hypothetical protein
MQIAKEKYKTNIVEYVLYMYNIEDIVRANNLEMRLLENTVISKYALPEAQLEEIRKWYAHIIESLKANDAEKAGHTKALDELAHELNDLHIQLLNSLDEERYQELYRWASTYMKELKEKLNNKELNEVQVCLHGLYSLMLLKIQGREISEETAQAMSTFSMMLRYLAKKYHDRREAVQG